MIDWNLAAKIAGGGFGMVFLILAILALMVWLMGLGVRKFSKGGSKNEEKRQK
jgi:Na+-transporting methylmalonyl-CoA/oxaloacetate decarboxylase gamma subunit